MHSLFLYLFFINFFIIISNLLLFLIRFNFILVLLILEIIIFYINLNFIIISLFYNDITGEIFSLFIVSIAGIEISVGLALLIIYYKLNDLIYINKITFIKS